jgi:predicted  nucleic acid-binding Zn-ribbon protein
MAERRDDNGGEGVLVQVCIECGKEYSFVEGEAPAELTCEKCGNQVFRPFYDRSEDEVARDFDDDTARDTRTDDPATDVTRGDLTDLKNL